MSRLDDLRKEIDSCDQEIIQAFSRRMEAARQVAEYKKETGMAIFDRERERRIIEDRTGRVPGELKDGTATLFETLMAVSRDYQKKQMGANVSNPTLLKLAAAICDEPSIKRPRVAYAGTEGSYGHTAADTYFKEKELTAYRTFPEVYEAVKNGAVDFGVLPIENSSTGSVRDALNLFDGACYICGEQTVQVRHCIAAPEGATLAGLREVYSHEQGLLQSAEFLKEYPDIQTKSYENTALAAQYVAQAGDRTKGAICSKEAAKRFGLLVLAEAVNFSSVNTTRFVILANRLIVAENADKLSVEFTLPHVSGSLFKTLAILAQNGLNMTKLESVPIPEKRWEYRFYVDFDGNLRNAKTLYALEDVFGCCTACRILGNYKENSGAEA